MKRSYSLKRSWLFPMALAIGAAFFVVSSAHAAHSADTNHTCVIGLQEVLRGIQLFNMSGYACDTAGASEDGYTPGPAEAHNCVRHNSDFDATPWKISLQELLRLAQFYNMSGYHCAANVGDSDDGFLPGPDAAGCPCGTVPDGEGETETYYLPGDVPLEMVGIPSGSFQMGSPDTERGRESDEGPAHTVNIAYDFYMGKYEVTKAQWLALMGTAPSPWNCSVGGNYPAHYVSWNDAQDFITALNSHSGQTFRLPSEAEWEYACRAETQTRFYFGDSLSVNDYCEDDGVPSQYMWYCGNNRSYGSKPVGGMLPNAFGLYDMSGNLCEWCQDRWHDTYAGAPTDGSARELPAASYRVFRGGSWDFYATWCRAASRGHNTPSRRFSYFGFRVALVR